MANNGDRTKGQIFLKLTMSTTGGSGITWGSTSQGNCGLTVVVCSQDKITTKQLNGKRINIRVNYFAKDPVTDFVIDTITIPFTVNNAGATPAFAFINQEFPKITGNLKDLYAQNYRYSEWVHSIGGASGEAELRGNDLVLALNGFGQAFNNHPGGTRHQQAGTWAHELLHTINFLHGGPKYLISDASQTTLGDTAKNCKPYPGVDKYTRQLPNLYLDLALVTPGNDYSDVISSSEWQLEYTDGTHGINLQEATTETAHFNALVLAGTTVGGLDEAALVEDLTPNSQGTPGISGTPYTMVWATPTTAFSHGTPDATHKQLSNLGDVDWNDSNTIATSAADINNFGISGCVAGVDAEYFDYDTGYHADLVFKQGSMAGQFDGITVSNVDPTNADVWRSIAEQGTFEGLDPQDIVETGEFVVHAGSTHAIFLQLLGQVENIESVADPLFLETAARAEVWVTKDPDATVEGDDPRFFWRKIIDNKPNTVDSAGDPLTPAQIAENAQFMRWDQDTIALKMDWKTWKNTKQAGLSGQKINFDGDWFIRIVLSDNPLGIGETPFVCDAMVVEQLPGGIADPNGCFMRGAGLFGERGEVDSNFLQDLVSPCIDETACGPLDAGDHLKATGKVILTLGGPENPPGPPPGEQDEAIDLLIGEHDIQAAEGNMKKKANKDLRPILVEAKGEFVLGNDVLACELVDDYEAAVESLPLRDLNQDARNELSPAVDALQFTETCIDLIPTAITI